MINNLSEKVFYLTEETLSKAIGVCNTLPGYHVLVCVDNEQSKLDFRKAICDSLNNSSKMKSRGIRSPTVNEYYDLETWELFTYIEFPNHSEIHICTNLGMNRYVRKEIHTALVYDEVIHAEAAIEYAKTMVQPYKIPKEYISDDGLSFKNTEYIRPIKRREIDTSAMDNFLEEI